MYPKHCEKFLISPTLRILITSSFFDLSNVLGKRNQTIVILIEIFQSKIDNICKKWCVLLQIRVYYMTRKRILTD